MIPGLMLMAMNIYYLYYYIVINFGLFILIYVIQTMINQFNEISFRSSVSKSNKLISLDISPPPPSISPVSFKLFRSSVGLEGNTIGDWLTCSLTCSLTSSFGASFAKGLSGSSSFNGSGSFNGCGSFNFNSGFCGELFLYTVVSGFLHATGSDSCGIFPASFSGISNVNTVGADPVGVYGLYGGDSGGAYDGDSGGAYDGDSGGAYEGEYSEAYEGEPGGAYDGDSGAYKGETGGA